MPVNDDPATPHAPRRIVTPRHRAYKVLPVVAIHKGDCISESGEVQLASDLVANLREYPPTLFCKLGAADFLAELNSVYLLRTPHTWQWRASSHERAMNAPNGIVQAARVTTAIHFFGWKGGNYHKIIDPITMYGHRLDTIWPDEVTVVDDPDWRTLVKLLRWGVTLRDFCQQNNLDIRPTLGSIGAQFLTDQRFYPSRRRKVPAPINERTRENLPGNHYFLNVEPSPSNNFTAHYLDQHRAHHYHAQHTALPDSNHCYAYGCFRDLSIVAFERPDPDFHGLYCLDLSAPKHGVPFDWIGDRLERVFVYSNELTHLLDTGYSVNGVRAAWGSLKRDTGLSQYATWAASQLNSHNDAPWLKPLLLSTYGTLATRPLNGEAIFRLANGGEATRIRTGKRELNGKMVQNPRKLEPRTSYVLQRGMIEAACRSESVGLAQWLTHTGHRVLAIYADAVMVECDDDKTLPSLPLPWRYKRTLNHLQFINHQAFMSDGMTKLPGVSREAFLYRQKTMPGHAPRRMGQEALTGKAISTGRRI